jgi:hypothetical protein
MTAPLLAYDTPHYPRPSVALHYVALACGLLPLGIGTAIFVLYLFFRFEDLAVYGIFTILGGTCLALIGFVCAGVYFFQAGRAAPEDGAVARRRVKIDVGIILANFPIAFAMAWAGIYLMSRVTITVINRDASPADQFRIIMKHGGVHHFGTIAPGSRESVTMDEDDFDGELTAAFIRNGAAHEQELADDWYDSDGDDRIYLSIKDDQVAED